MFLFSWVVKNREKRCVVFFFFLLNGQNWGRTGKDRRICVLGGGGMGKGVVGCVSDAPDEVVWAGLCLMLGACCRERSRA